MSPIGSLHLIFSLLAVLFGAVVLRTIVAVGSCSVFGAGSWLIRRKLAASLAATPAAMR